MKKFIFTILNEDHTLHKSTYSANSVSEAYQLWIIEFGDCNFIGNLNINEQTKEGNQ